MTRLKPKEETNSENSNEKPPLSNRIVLYLFLVPTLILTYQVFSDVIFLFQIDIDRSFFIPLIMDTLVLTIITIYSWYALVKMNKTRHNKWKYTFILPLIYVLYSTISTMILLNEVLNFESFIEVLYFDSVYIYGLAALFYILGFIFFIVTKGKEKE